VVKKLNRILDTQKGRQENTVMVSRRVDIIASDDERACGPGEVASVAFAETENGTILFIPSFGSEQSPGCDEIFSCKIVKGSEVIVLAGNFSAGIRELIKSIGSNAKGYIEGGQERVRKVYESVKCDA